MTWRTLRRPLAAVAITAALSLVSSGPAAAGALRWRETEPAPARAVAGRSLMAELWTVLVSIWETSGVVMDNNGGR
jgi:hypothetical protein